MLLITKEKKYRGSKYLLGATELWNKKYNNRSSQSGIFMKISFGIKSTTIQVGCVALRTGLWKWKSSVNCNEGGFHSYLLY